MEKLMKLVGNINDLKYFKVEMFEETWTIAFQTKTGPIITARGHNFDEVCILLENLNETNRQSNPVS